MTEKHDSSSHVLRPLISSSLLHSNPPDVDALQHVFTAYPLLLIHGYLFLDIHSIKVYWHSTVMQLYIRLPFWLHSFVADIRCL